MFYEDSLKELAADLSNLRYDKLEEFLDELGNKLLVDYSKDVIKGRSSLATCLARASEDLLRAQLNIRKAWEICKIYEENK